MSEGGRDGTSQPQAVAGSSGSNFWGSALTYTVGAMAFQGISFLLTPIFSHLMTGAEMGLAVNYLFWTTLFGILISLQLNGTLNNVVTHYGQDHLPEFLRNVVPWYAGPSAALLAVLLVARHWWEDLLGVPWPWLALAIANGVCIAATTMALSHAVVTGRRLRYLLLTFLATIAGALVGLLLIGVMADDAFARVLGYFAGSVLVVVVLLPDVIKSPGHRGKSAGYLAFALPIALPLLAHELLWQVTSNANRVIVLQLESATEAGIFAFAATLGSVAALTAAAVNAAWTPWYFANTKAGAIEATKAAARDLMFGFTLLMAVAILISPEVLKLVSGEAFRSGDELVPIFIGVGVLTFVFNLATNYLVYIRRTRLVLLISAIGCALTVGLSVATIPVWGTVGVAAVSFGAIACMAVAALAVGYRLGCRNLPHRLMVAIILGTACLLAATGWLGSLPMVRFGVAAVVLAALGIMVASRLLARQSR